MLSLNDLNSCRRLRRWALGLPALALLALPGCFQTKAPSQPPAPPPPTVSVAEVTVRDVPVYIDQIGRCASPEVVSIRPQASGQIVKIDFTEGAELKAGQPLFTIDSAPYQSALNQAEAEDGINVAALAQSDAVLTQYRAQLEEAKADLAQSQTRQELNIVESRRAESLKGVISQTDYDAKKMAESAGAAQIRSNQAVIGRVEAQIKQAAAAIDMAKAKINSSQAAIATAKINLQYTKITSPIDGRAGQRMVDLGNVVTSTSFGGGGTPMLTIQRMDPVYTEFSVPERELSHVRASMAAGTLKVECRIPEKPEMPYEGEVYFIDNAVADGTGTIRLRARVPNKDRALWPGQFVKVRMIYEIKKNAVLVPAIVPQISQTGPYVYVVTVESTVQFRPIKLGQRHGEMVAIDEGLKSGERIVTSGPLMLMDKMKVAPADESKPAPADVAKSGVKKDAATSEEPK